MNWYDPQNWLDLVDHAWYGLVLIAVAAIPAVISAKNNKGIQRIKDQVVNGHTVPLRSDLDMVIEKIDAISASVANLRQELIDEESRRRAHIGELRDDMDRKFHHLAERLTG